MDKTRLVLLIVGVVLVGSIGILFSVRFLIGGNEDTWLCVDNQWVKHGNPLSPAPLEGCENGSVGQVSNWASYSNTGYKFEIDHPSDWKIEAYGPFQAASQKLFEVLLTQNTDNYGNNPNREVYWMIDVWKQSVTDAQIAIDSGFSKFDLKNVNLNSVSMVSSSQPSPISNKTENYRLFVVQGQKYVYSLKSSVCQTESDAACSGVLSSFRVTD